MGKREYGYDVREQAEDLFVYEGRTFEEVAQATGVSVQQLKKWAEAQEIPDGERVPSWTEKRRRSQHLQGVIKYKLQEARLKVLEQVIQEPSNQNFQSLHLIEKILAGKADTVDRPKAFTEDLQFVAETLKEIDPEGLKVLARSFDAIVARWKERNAA